MAVWTLALCAAPALTLAPYPFRLRLEDVQSTTKAEVVHSAMQMCVGANLVADALCDVTPSGHVLFAMPDLPRGWSSADPSPLGCLRQSPTFPRQPMLVDAVKVFESDRAVYRCFVTTRRQAAAVAARIRGTNVWVLVAPIAGMCNELRSRIDRREFDEIQRGFVALLTDGERFA